MPAKIKCLVTVQCGLEHGAPEKCFKLSMPEGSTVQQMIRHVLEKPERAGGSEWELGDRFECADVKAPDEDFGGELVSVPVEEPLVNRQQYRMELSPRSAGAYQQQSGSTKDGESVADLIQFDQQVGCLIS